LGLALYEQAFRENDIDAEVLAPLTADDLIGVGVTSVGHRRKLLAAIAALRNATAPTSLPVPGAPAAISGVASPLPEAERRQVTVLFADLAGYTKLADELDAEEVHALLGSFFDLADASVADLATLKVLRAQLRPIRCPRERSKSDSAAAPCKAATDPSVLVRPVRGRAVDAASQARSCPASHRYLLCAC
jgi:class 3 adenylate cyclase